MLYDESLTPEERLGAVREGIRLEADCSEKLFGRRVSNKPLERLQGFKGLTLKQTEELRDEFFNRSLERSDESYSWELASEVLSNFLKPSWA